jgi:hypothetical protein
LVFVLLGNSCVVDAQVFIRIDGQQYSANVRLQKNVFFQWLKFSSQSYVNAFVFVSLLERPQKCRVRVVSENRSALNEWPVAHFYEFFHCATMTRCFAICTKKKESASLT